MNNPHQLAKLKSLALLAAIGAMELSLSRVCAYAQPAPMPPPAVKPVIPVDPADPAGPQTVPLPERVILLEDVLVPAPQPAQPVQTDLKVLVAPAGATVAHGRKTVDELMPDEIAAMDPKIREMMSQHRAAMAELADMETKFGPNSPNVIRGRENEQRQARLVDEEIKAWRAGQKKQVIQIVPTQVAVPPGGIIGFNGDGKTNTLTLRADGKVTVATPQDQAKSLQAQMDELDARLKELKAANEMLAAGAALAKGGTPEQVQATQLAVIRSTQDKLEKEREALKIKLDSLNLPFLGIVADSLPAGAREKLALPAGLGLVVLRVEPGSPGAAAGLKEKDVLLRVNDQQLFNEAQLRALLGTFKSGDEVRLSIIRDGQPSVITVKLLTRAQAAMTLKADQVIATMSGNIDMNKVNAAGAPMIRAERITLQSEGMRFELSGTDDARHLRYTDKDGKVLFDGPIATEEQRKAVPAEARKWLEQFGQVDQALPGMAVRTLQLQGVSGSVSKAGDGKLTMWTPAEPAPAEQRLMFAEGGVQLMLDIRRPPDARIQSTLVAKDKEGKVLFEGPVDTAEQRAKMPQVVADMFLQALLGQFREAGGIAQPWRIKVGGDSGTAPRWPVDGNPWEW